MMQITYNVAKCARNIRERGLPFDLVEDLDWSTALVEEDTRRTYPERRFIAFGMIEERLYSVCFTPTAMGIRVISFRKANKREVKAYDEKTIHQ